MWKLTNQNRSWSLAFLLLRVRVDLINFFLNMKDYPMPWSHCPPGQVILMSAEVLLVLTLGLLDLGLGLDNKCHHQKSGSKYIYSTNTNQFVLTTKPNGNPELEDWRDEKNFTDLTFPGLPYLLAKVLSILYFLSFYAAEILIGIMYLHYHGVIYRQVSTLSRCSWSNEN